MTKTKKMRPIIITSIIALVSFFVGYYAKPPIKVSNQNLTFGQISIPNNFSASKLYLMSKDGKQYIIEKSGYSSGPCPWEDDGTNCVGHDESLSGYTTLRIWNNNQGVVAINPQGNSQEDSYVIYKFDPNNKSEYTYLTDEEVSMWKSIL